MTPHPAISRFRTTTARRVIGALAALAIAGGIAAGPAVASVAAPRAAASSTRSSSDAADFVDSLDPEQRERLAGGYPNVAGTGLRLGDLGPVQRAGALALLRSLLSTAAWAEFADLMAADAALDAAAGGGSEWSVDDYHLALFGDPEGDFVLQFSTADVTLSAIHQGGTVDVRPDVVVSGQADRAAGLAQPDSLGDRA